MRGLLSILVLCHLVVLVLPRGSARGRSRLKQPDNSISGRGNTISGRVKCPAVTFRRKGCRRRYECENVCEDKIKCKTRYQYKCTNRRRQECKDVWQNKCNGRGRRRRRSALPQPRGPPYWLDPANTQQVDDPPPPADPGGPPLLDPGAGGQVFDFASEPRSKRCWMKVRKCEYKTYRTTCGNVPIKTCDDKPSRQCKKKCKNVYYCDMCKKPTSRPRPRPPTTSRPRPTPPPTVGPPSPPPPGTVFISPPAPPSNREPILDAKRNKRRNRKTVP